MTAFQILSAPHTPLREDGSLHEAVLGLQIERAIRTGLDGAFVCGSTGEGTSLTLAERKTIAEAWVRGGKGRLRVIVHAGHDSIEEAKGLARHATRCGADAFAAVPPIYFRPATHEVLAACVREIASAAQELPFYYYHIPSRTGVDLPMRPLLDLISDVPNFRGIKFSHHDLLDFQRCRTFEGGRYELFWGSDETLLSARAAGACGAVGSTYNHSLGLYRHMLASASAGDETAAREASSRAAEMVAAMLREGVIAAGKTIMTRLGIPCGPPRLPLQPLGEEAQARLFTKLDSLGVLDLAS